MGATRRPLHLLLLDETFTHQLVHRRLHEGRADPYPYISIPDPTRRGGIYLFDQYRLVIGGVGIVYDGESRSEAQTRFISTRRSVTLFKNYEILSEYPS